ncbi:hypothetical protein BT93_F0230 [Corymbia citriodora subsp. variegata]|nr:hypothetical protein BT93_F0230 [Corymbia citriodora subsp. variegata]
MNNPLWSFWQINCLHAKEEMVGHLGLALAFPLTGPGTARLTCNQHIWIFRQAMLTQKDTRRYQTFDPHPHMWGQRGTRMAASSQTSEASTSAHRARGSEIRTVRHPNEYLMVSNWTTLNGFQ